jgi:hypothetical protein
MQLRRIGVSSAAKVMGVLYSVLGLIAGVIIGCISLVSAGFISRQNPDMPPWFGSLFGVGAIVLFPIMYGIMGVVFGAAVAAIYNGVAGIVGGIEVELLDAGAAPSTTAR